MTRLLLIFFLAPLLTFGQFPPDRGYPFSPEYTGPSETIWNLGRLANVSAADILTHLKDRSELDFEGSTLVLLDSVSSPGGWHFNFQQQCNGVEVYGAGVKVNVGKDGRIRSVFNHTIPVPADLSKEFPPDKFRNIEMEEEVTRTTTTSVYFLHNGELLPCFRTEIEEVDYKHYEVIFSSTEVLYVQDLNRYLMSDSTVTAKVFLPDPLTTAGKTYGGAYADLGDADNTELNNERFDVTMVVDFTNDTFRLFNPYVIIEDFDSPATQIATSTIADFDFTRSQDQFEDVNCFYHISTFQNYMQYLGFNLVNYQLAVDAHALNGAENSLFSYPKLYFGDGCVDDAEDPDVIIHEYGHAITASAAPNTWVGSERKALDEAAGDYLATSYTRFLNPFNWQLMFGWDGNNSCWAGRTAATTKHYPEDLSGSIHKDGEIWNAALMQIWEVIGRETTDQIYLQSIYGYAQNMTMTDAAYLFLDADSTLNGGANYITSYYWLQKRGFIDTLSFFSGADAVGTFATCNGACDALAVVGVMGGVPPYTYVWTDSLGTVLSAASDTATGLCAGNYSVFMTDAAGDTVTVQVKAREVAPLSFSSTVLDALCTGSNTGSVDADVEGGLPIYSYLWSSGDQTDDISSLLAGSYTVTVTDQLGCTITDSVVVGEQTTLTATMTTLPDSGNGEGSATVMVTNVTGVLTYSWSDSLGQITATASGLSAGNYVVLWVDSLGCSGSTAAVIELFIGAPIVKAGKMTIYPNPTDGLIYISTEGYSQPLFISIVNVFGQTIYTNDILEGQAIDLSTYTSGLYTIIVSDKDQILHRKKLILH